MPSNPYYQSSHWRMLRQAALRRDGYACAVDGCCDKASHVDHIQARPRGVATPTPADRIDNLRCLCKYHDAQVKEDRFGKRQNAGQFAVIGCDQNGMPLDPNHPWNR